MVEVIRPILLKPKPTVREEIEDDNDQTMIRVDKHGNPHETRKTVSHNRGKLAEGEVKPLLQSATTYCWRVADTRNYAALTQCRMMIPKVKSDFEAYALDKTIYKKNCHYYFEVKSSKVGTSFPLQTALRDSVHQWTWAKRCWENGMAKCYYTIVNRHSPGMFFVCVMDWPGIERLFIWCDSISKTHTKSVPWEKIKKESLLVLYQDEEDMTNQRFNTPDNIKKLKDILGVPENLMTYEEFDYVW